MEIEPIFYNDREVARIFSLSAAWVRVQRFRRKRGEPHVLEVDPRYIGSCPRYVKAEIDAFAGALAA